MKCTSVRWTLIKKGKAYVCELNADQIREYRGTLKEPGKESPYRNRSWKKTCSFSKTCGNGKFADGERGPPGENRHGVA